MKNVLRPAPPPSRINLNEDERQQIVVELTGGQALARQLVAEGVETIFGIPGAQLDFATDGLAREAPGINFVVPRHEQTTTYMADGYARVNEEPGVAMVVPGPGMLNGMAGLSTAYACNSRVLYVVGQIPTNLIGKDLGFLHEIPRQSETLHSLVKWSGIAHTVEEVPALVQSAFQQLRSGRPRPVAIEIPPDVLATAGQVEILGRAAPIRSGPIDAGAMKQIAHALATAKRPLIMAGNGVEAVGARAELVAVAERLNAVVSASWWGRSAFDDRHRLALHRNPATAYLMEADVVLVIGSRFVDRLSRKVKVGAQTKVFGINIEPNDLAGDRDYAGSVVADAKEALMALLELLPTPSAAVDPQPRLRELRAAFMARLAGLEPQACWVRAIRAALPDDGIFVNDLTQVGFAAELAFETRDPRSFITAGYQGTLGFAFPTALGLKAGAPRRTVVAVTGDGGFGYALQELATARRYGIGVVTVLFTDGYFGNVRRIQKEHFGGRVYGAELTNPDFQALGRAFGVHTELVETPEALTRAIAARESKPEPSLIQVPVGEMPSPWPFIHGI